MRTSRILLVDDLQENLFSLKSLLSGDGVLIDTALSGEEALHYCLNNDYDLFIFDVQMPEMDGFQLAEYLKGYSQTKDIPIIFVTAISNDISFVKKGYESGAVDYLSKPIDDSLMKLKVKTFLQLYHQKKELQIKKNEISAILKSIPDTLMEVGLDLSVQTFYPSSEHLFLEGIEYSNLNNLKQILKPDYCRTIQNSIQKICSSKVVDNLEIAFERENDNNLYYELRFAKLKIDRALIVFRDISELKKAEQLLLRQNSFLKDQNVALENSQKILQQDKEKIEELVHTLNESQSLAKIGSWSYNPKSQLLRFSKEQYNILQIEKTDEGPVFEQFFEKIHSDDVLKFENLFFRTDNKQSTFSFEYRLICATNYLKYIWCEGVILRDEFGHVEEFRGTSQDVTLRKHYEKKIASNELVLNELLASINEVVFSMENEAYGENKFKLSYLNGHTRQVFGYSRVDLIESKIDYFERIHPDDIAAVNDSIAQLRSGAKQVLRQYRFMHKDGYYVWLEDNISMVLSDNGIGSKIFGSIRDISEQKKAQALMISNDEKIVLLKEIHHRVKNNLQVITSLLSLQASYMIGDAHKKIFSDSQFRINSMAIVHEMLYQSDNLSKINYYDYLHELANYLITSMHGKDSGIDLELNVANISLNIDTAVPLGLLINEVITNSLKYAFPGGKGCIIITVLKDTEQDNAYLLNIGDNGIGFNDDVATGKSKSLGMKLIKSLTRQLHGTIQKVHAQKGTQYHITFKEI